METIRSECTEQLQVELKPGKTYEFLHKRKGIFTARFLGLEPGKPGEKPFVRVEIQTHRGSPFERLANVATTIVEVVNGKTVMRNAAACDPPAWSDKLLRQDLIAAIREASDLPERVEGKKPDPMEAWQAEWNKGA